MTFVESCQLSVGREDSSQKEHVCCAACYRPYPEDKPWLTNHCEHLDRWQGGTGKRLPALYQLPNKQEIEAISNLAAMQ